ncbi:DinB family protein [Dyadobacter sp. CY323]|uniref:DinB family protein n=1 Tax=Dyadobacter sp. CY323 TaxID=2907302 RepID=UPI001F3E3B86|nr:DinB family protein [Dyadobacter sp. CY323]MCE6987761.1 DinB family protein [Dyadobacter sp. CY323]
MEKDQRKKLVDELISLTINGHAHVTFEDAVADLPANLRGKTPENLPYSIWQLVDHLRIAQKDIVDFSTSDDYHELKWPDDYWSDPVTEVDDETWERSLEQIQQDRKRFFELLKDENNDLTKPFPWGSGQTLLREALLIADHNAYHTAEIVVIRRLLKSWR